VVSSGTCAASYYWEPQPTASGEEFDPEALTAAHKSLPFDTRVRVTNLRNGKSVVFRINDRGPYVDGRCLDLARGAFRAIESLDAGVAHVRYESSRVDPIQLTGRPNPPRTRGQLRSVVAGDQACCSAYPCISSPRAAARC
jgi:rare lipoprotein A (peptidoglycan hydrolase)